jgi:hypothetical protein
MEPASRLVYLRDEGNASSYSGRDISERDGPNSPRVAVVSEAFVRRIISGRNPMGQTFHFVNTTNAGAGTYEIVGVVSDMKYESAREAVFSHLLYPRSFSALRSIAMRPGPHVFIHTTCWYDSSANAVSPSRSKLRAALHKAEPDVPVAGISYNARASGPLARARRNT